MRVPLSQWHFLLCRSGRALSPGRLRRDQHEPSSRAGRRLLQQARHGRAVDQRRQGCDQVDAAVMPDIRRQRGASAASCARLQPWQLPALTGDTRADQGLVAVEPEGEADQDRREDGEPWPLCRLPDGRGRHPAANVPGDSAADRGTTAAAATSAGVRCSMVMHSRAAEPPAARVWLPRTLENRYYSRQFGSHLGNVGLN